MVIGPPVCWQALNHPAPPQFERRRGTVGGREGWTLSSLELRPEAPRSHQAGELGDDPEGCLLPRFNQRVLTHWWVLGSTFEPTGQWAVGVISACGLAPDRGGFSDLHVGKLPWAMCL